VAKELSEHEAALESERRDRAVALLGLPELIAGIRVSPLTPRRLEWLRAFSNPFICGGAPSPAAILQFLWFVSPDFSFETSEEKRLAFIAQRAELDYPEAREGIEVYLDRAFLDAPNGSEKVSYYAPTVGLYHTLNEYYPHAGWSLEAVLNTPLSIIYQLIKAGDKARGAAVVNRRSFEVQARWLDTLETITASTQQLLLEKVAEKRLQGYGQVSLSSRNRDGTWSCAIKLK
jgi:hypothetical protein